MIQGDLEKEVVLLRDKLTRTEDDFEEYKKNTSLALTEANLKINAVMTRLLAANDVSKRTPFFAPMRTNILEHMNDLRRQINGFFINAGIVDGDSWRQ